MTFCSPSGVAHARRTDKEADSAEDDLDSEDWFTLGTDLEGAAPEHAREAYRRTRELDPGHVEARVNLGRLLHEAGHVDAAESHYRVALGAQPRNATALFNLGVSLEDRERHPEAERAYRDAIESDPKCADACYNLARLLEQRGESTEALRFLNAYRKLTEDR